MSATHDGGVKARDTNYKYYGRDFYRRIGAMGGKKGKKDGTFKGFFLDRERARRAGALGGSISRRGPK